MLCADFELARGDIAAALECLKNAERFKDSANTREQAYLRAWYLSLARTVLGRRLTLTVSNAVAGNRGFPETLPRPSTSFGAFCEYVRALYSLATSSNKFDRFSCRPIHKICLLANGASWWHFWLEMPRQYLKWLSMLTKSTAPPVQMLTGTLIWLRWRLARRGLF